jgi:hypothetical protein
MLDLFACLDEQAAIWNLHAHFLPFASPNRQAREVALPVYSQKVQIRVPASKYSARLVVAG